MNFLIVSQYFWPESFLINDLARTLRKQGHGIVVITGKPNYPDGRVFEGYTARGVQRELFGGDIEVLRVPLRPRGASGALNLVLNYMSFVWSGLRWFPSLLRRSVFDVILVFAVSPVTMAIPAIPVKWRSKAHLAIWVQDLWPDSLAATGFIRNRAVLSMVGLIVRGIYACADTLLVQSPAFIAPVSRYARGDAVVYYPNSLDISGMHESAVTPIPSDLRDVLATGFCVVFAGNMGTGQAIETLLEAADRLRDLPDVRFVLVGSGRMLDWAIRQKVERGLDNVVLAGRFPMGSMPEIYRRASCLVVTLKGEEAFLHTVPTKILAYLAAGRPIIASLNGEAARVVTEAGAGLTCAAEDSEALARCVRTLYGMPADERERLGAEGRRYFLEHFEMGRQAGRLVEILEGRMRSKNGAV